jgi:hypothetical protein
MSLKRPFDAIDSANSNAPPVKWVRIGNSMRFKKIGILDAEYTAPTPSPSPREEADPLTPTKAARELAPSPPTPSKAVRNFPFSELKKPPPFMGPRRRLAPFPVVGMALWRF